MNVWISLLSINKFQFSSYDFFQYSPYIASHKSRDHLYIFCGKMRHRISSHRVDRHRGEQKHISENRDTKEKYRMEWELREACDPLRETSLRERSQGSWVYL